MVEPRRRLAAIMFTEMVGFTAMVQADEQSALASLERHNALLRPIFAQYHGREVKTMGDAFLVEFESALDATSCAIAIQRKLREEAAEPSGSTAVQIRIGIHLGDVVHEGNDVLGDAVNIASRLQPLAEAGGICISGQVFDQVHNKLRVRYEKLAPTALKNVAAKVEVYRVGVPGKLPPARSSAPAPRRLAVLPFAHISAGRKDEYFADGLTEELIGGLCQLRHLRVIARGSVSRYKASSKSVGEIGAELGVGWLLTGSVRTSGNRLRITAQLIDVGSGEHTSLGTYNRTLGDVFAVQAEIAREVASHLRLELGSAEEARLTARPLVEPESYLAYLRGRTRLHDRSRAALFGARHEFERAVALDPGNAAALSGLADVTRLLGRYRHLDPADARTQSRLLATRAVEIDPDLAEAHASLGLVLHDDYRFAAAEREFRLAVSLSPSSAHVRHSYALLLEDQGRGEDALRELALAQEADPHSDLIRTAHATLCVYLERFDEAWEKIARLGAAESPSSLYYSALCLYLFVRAEYEKLLPALQRLEALRPDESWVLAARGVYHASKGEAAEAAEIARRLEAMPEALRSESEIADIYAHLNRLDTCFEWLERAFESRDLQARYWVLDPTHVAVVRDARFRTLLGRMNLG